VANGFRIGVNDSDGNNSDGLGLSALAFDPSAGILTMAQALAAANASASLNGLPIASAGNTLSEVLDGITMTLGKVTDAPVQVQAKPDVSERELGNVTWIVDYNRQNLDGARMPNKHGLHGTDAHRIQAMSEANGWEVIQVRHGRRRLEVFKRPGGERLRAVFEEGFSDYELQMHLLMRDMDQTRRAILEHEPTLTKLLDGLPDEQLETLLTDVGGHDTGELVKAYKQSKKDARRPTLIVAHTVKGWGMDMYAAPGNHSELPRQEEVEGLLATEGLTLERPFAPFAEESDEARYVAELGERFRHAIDGIRGKRRKNREWVRRKIQAAGGVPKSLEIDTKLFPRAHTQWMWGQLASKLARIGTTAERRRLAGEDLPELPASEKAWEATADFLLTMSPDVGTSTQISAVMDQKVYGTHSEDEDEVDDVEERLGVHKKRPILLPTTEPWTRHIRFEIAGLWNFRSLVGRRED
jgi:pyruvate dehydrogenase E1 component